MKIDPFALHTIHRFSRIVYLQNHLKGYPVSTLVHNVSISAIVFSILSDFSFTKTY
jgi:hypothetical protein